MKSVCNRDACAGCKLCSDICPVNAINVDVGLMSCNAWINESKCINCGLCHKCCPQNETPELISPTAWYQGWSMDSDVRAGSSSGGLAMELAQQFIKNNGEVCTCYFQSGEFRFYFFDDLVEVRKTAGSKYVKSNPEGIYKPLLEKLKSGKKILMIGLPCQIAAAKNYVKEYAVNFYTVDLICHGTPAPDLLRIYLKDKGIFLDKLQDIKFRRKDGFYLQGDYKTIEKYHMDAYTYAFLNSLIYTENCYSCSYAKLSRVSDITLGDSWGSELREDEKQKGISLILCQTEKGKVLLDMASLRLVEVDLQKAVAANKQLAMPSVRPKGRNAFLNGIQKGKGFEDMLYRIDPVRGLKNFIREFILRIPFGGVSADN